MAEHIISKVMLKGCVTGVLHAGRHRIVNQRTACAVAVKAKNFSEAAKSAAGAVDCVGIIDDCIGKGKSGRVC